MNGDATSEYRFFPWQTVTCSSCMRTYQCTPSDDYYNATTPEDGVCEPCLYQQIFAKNREREGAQS